MEIEIARTAGFCFGVKRAIDMTEKTLETESNVYSIGNIVHNKYIVEKLKKKGLTVVDNINDIPNGTVVIIRAHGVTKKDIELCKEKNLKIVDTTCPKVAHVHDIAEKYSNDGYAILIIGEAAHPEVIGLKGWSNSETIVIDENFDVASLDNNKKYCVVSQTTMNKSKNEEIISKLKENIKELVVFNTVCLATEERQNELKSLAKTVDSMIIIGDKTSSNSNRLYEISKSICNNSYFIENIDELCLNFSDSSCKIGITAGASTPSELITEVYDKLVANK
ncbi:MAG: 4-hydroxy-3-methylbut-2-enyl diphosphate reductase [Clostridia bacterium]|nr:4-hydroxy-3-methylbut-2-enyl diphosphate reductase [Clostridia bacterium]